MAGYCKTNQSENFVIRHHESYQCVPEKVRIELKIDKNLDSFQIKFIIHTKVMVFKILFK